TTILRRNRPFPLLGSLPTTLTISLPFLALTHDRFPAKILFTTDINDQTALLYSATFDPVNRLYFIIAKNLLGYVVRVIDVNNRKLVVSMDGLRYPVQAFVRLRGQ